MSMMRFIRGERQQQGAKSERIAIRFPEGTLARIHAVLRGGELMADLARTAIDAELRRREKRAKASD